MKDSRDSLSKFNELCFAWERFATLERRLVPLAQELNLEQRQAAQRLVAHFLAEKPKGLKRRLALFLALIDLVSLFMGGRVFARLPATRQDRVLNFFYHSRFSLLRKGFWGLNTLAKLSVYGQESIYPRLHYQLRATPHE